MNVLIKSMKRIVRRTVLLVTIACLAATTTVVAQDDETVQVTDYGTVTLTVKDTDLAQVLEMLAIQSKKNIITSKSVSATISANLYDVTFYEALDAILRVNGYGYIEEGNFIYVYTGAEMTEYQARLRQTESRVFQLEYLAATDAFEFIVPLLSDAGQASFRGEVDPGFKPEISDGGADGYAFTPTLVVNDYSDNLDQIGVLLETLDKAPQQVLVEATILQTTLDEANAFGVDFSIIGDMNFADLTRPLSSVTNLFNGSDSSEGFQPADNKAGSVSSTVGNTAGTAGLRVGIVTDDISVFLRVLDEVTDSTVLARPKIMCLNRQRAEVLVGARVGYLSTTATETTTTQTVEFLDTGIQLVFRPFISPNGMIRLELAPSVSEASLRSVTDSNGLVVTIPDELTNELTTNVRVRDGRTLVLGGLFRESTRITRRQIPILGDIPLIGAAFRGQDDIIDRDEIIFLITPTIIDDESLVELGEDALAYAESSRVGVREGLLPFSQGRMTGIHNRDAMAAYQRGDLEEALFYTNLSLRMRSSQPEMVRFRSQITGTAFEAHDHSLMERVLRREMGTIRSVDPRLESSVLGPIPPLTYTGMPATPLSPNWTDQRPLSEVLEAPMAVAPVAAYVPGPEPVAAVVSTPVPVTPVELPPIAEGQVYDDLFKSFFKGLEAPVSTAPTSNSVSAETTDNDEFEAMLKVVEVPSNGDSNEN